MEEKRIKFLSNMEFFIRNEMRLKKISQREMADALGMRQASFSYKLKKMKFNADELYVVFKILGTSKESAGRMMTL